jgi:hypothetical protein
VRNIHVILVAALVAGTALGKSSSSTSTRVSEPLTYAGMCGASAAASVDADFFIAADDEANELRVYDRDQGGAALQVIDLSQELELDRRAPETDIEGAARLGDKVFWITSHSRNASGREHANRYRFFATTIRRKGETVEVATAGQPYKRLLEDLLAAPELRSFNLKAASRLAPKTRGALNIEGLCATPDNQLLIGFRNPIPGGDALIVPLRNPAELLDGKPARFGAPIQLDLNGLGIRDMACWQGRYIIIGGPYDSGGRSRLFSWSGPGSRARHLKDIDLKGLNPEAVVIYPDLGLSRVELLSDDSRHQGDTPCKDVPAATRRFRGVWVSLEHEKKR